MTFKDHFSTQAALYVKYRPNYPVELYAYLASLTAAHDLAWDCGTGNGQAATSLAPFYKKVIATDPSEQQIENRLLNEKVIYLVEKAEQTSLGPGTADLVTVATALHWFGFDTFYKEVNRVVKNKGVIAAWAYGLPVISPEIDRIIRQFHDDTLNDYWLAENRLIEKAYTTIPFPFEEISSPAFYHEQPMRLDELVGYINTWSATQRFIRKNSFNPAERLYHDLKAVWEDQAIKTISWKLILKTGRVDKA